MNIGSICMYGPIIFMLHTWLLNWMGPFFLIKGTRANPANKLEWAQILLWQVPATNMDGPITFYWQMSAYRHEWARLFLQQVLPIQLNGPISSTASIVNKIDWAHLLFMAVAANKDEWAHYFLSQMLPISLNGPIYFCGRCCQWVWMGPYRFLGRCC